MGGPGRDLCGAFIRTAGPRDVWSIAPCKSPRICHRLPDRAIAFSRQFVRLPADLLALQSTTQISAPCFVLGSPGRPLDADSDDPGRDRVNQSLPLDYLCLRRVFALHQCENVSGTRVRNRTRKRSAGAFYHALRPYLATLRKAKIFYRR